MKHLAILLLCLILTGCSTVQTGPTGQRNQAAFNMGYHLTTAGLNAAAIGLKPSEWAKVTQTMRDKVLPWIQMANAGTTSASSALSAIDSSVPPESRYKAITGTFAAIVSIYGRDGLDGSAKALADYLRNSP